MPIPAERFELGPRIGIWGPFDLASYGDLLAARIFELELTRRLPFTAVTAYAPMGFHHPIALDGGRSALPLGRPDSVRRAELAESFDLIAVMGDVIHTHDDVWAAAYDAPVDSPSAFFIDGLGATLEAGSAVVWHAVGVPFQLDAADAERVKQALATKRYVSARDEVSRDRLLATGTDCEIAVVPDPLLLASRLFDADVLRKRLSYLRAMDWYPPAESPLVVQGDASLLPRVHELARALAAERLPVVVVELDASRGDRDFAEALFAELEAPKYRLPPAVTLEDVTAAIGHALGFTGSSHAGRAVATSFGVQARGWNEPEWVVGGVEELGAQFDALAALAEEAWARSERASAGALLRALSEADARYEALQRAHAALGERLVQERLRFAEFVAALDESAVERGEAALRIAELENRLEIAEAEAAERGDLA